MTKQVIVPQDKLDKLEEARVKLYEFYEHYIKTPVSQTLQISRTYSS